MYEKRYNVNFRDLIWYGNVSPSDLWSFTTSQLQMMHDISILWHSLLTCYHPPKDSLIV